MPVAAFAPFFRPELTETGILIKIKELAKMSKASRDAGGF
jgi:hypothetical protein